MKYEKDQETVRQKGSKSDKKVIFKSDTKVSNVLLLRKLMYVPWLS